MPTADAIYPAYKAVEYWKAYIKEEDRSRAAPPDVREMLTCDEKMPASGARIATEKRRAGLARVLAKPGPMVTSREPHDG